MDSLVAEQAALFNEKLISTFKHKQEHANQILIFGLSIIDLLGNVSQGVARSCNRFVKHIKIGQAKDKSIAFSQSLVNIVNELSNKMGAISKSLQRNVIEPLQTFIEGQSDKHSNLMERSKEMLSSIKTYQSLRVPLKEEIDKQGEKGKGKQMAQSYRQIIQEFKNQDGKRTNFLLKAQIRIVEQVNALVCSPTVEQSLEEYQKSSQQSQNKDDELLEQKLLQLLSPQLTNTKEVNPQQRLYCETHAFEHLFYSRKRYNQTEQRICNKCAFSSLSKFHNNIYCLKHNQILQFVLAGNSQLVENQQKYFCSICPKGDNTKPLQMNSRQQKSLENLYTTNIWQYGSGKTPSKFLISCWNVNGIRSVLNKKELSHYIDKAKPDIICINQTKIDYQAFRRDPISIEGYHSYWNFCKCSAGYSGVAVFSKYLPLAITEDLPQKEHSQEGRAITLEFEEFFLVTAYMPNSGVKLDRLKYRVQEYDKCFQQYCNTLKNKKTTIVCGDLSVCHQEIDIARPKGNEKTAGFTAEERQSFSRFLQSGWVDTFRRFHPTEVKYSWWSMRAGGRAKNIGWRIDYFLVDDKSIDRIKDSAINCDIFGSDHCLIQLIVSLN